jgi:ATP-binding cassette subfamily B protein
MSRNKYDEDEEILEEFNMDQFKRLLGYITPFKKEMIVTTIIMLISSVAGLLGPYLIEIAIDKEIPSKNINMIIVLSFIFLLTIIITGVSLKYKIRIMSYIGNKIVENLRKDIFAHLQELPFSYYDSRPHGKILVRVVNYVNSLSDLLSNGLINLVTDSFSLFVIIGFMILISPKLTLVCMAGLPILIAAIFILKKLQRKAFQINSNKQSNLNAYIHESITGMKVTQAFAREEENLNIFKGVSDEYRQTWFTSIKLQLLLWPCVDNISQLTISFVYMVGIYSIGSGITVGILIAFIGYIWRFWAPITNIANFYNSLVMTTAYIERIFETIDEPVDILDKVNASEISNIEGYVEFSSVNFGYDAQNTVLSSVSFKVNPGETIAFVGPTGAGKSTIINLLSRFYDVNSGVISIDGKDIRDINIKSLRQQMGIMPQDTFVFSGTIIDNIRYGKLDASVDEVIKAAKAASANEFIEKLENGYYTEVNERGGRLSAGEKQLLALARAFLANPKLLILDEATSSLDTKTEILVQNGIKQLLKGRTSFIIAHRLSTIKNSDKIMYVDNGTIIETGNHEELMNKKGAYYELYMSQYKMLEAV